LVVGSDGNVPISAATIAPVKRRAALLRSPRALFEKQNNPLTIFFNEHKIQTTDMETFPNISRQVGRLEGQGRPDVLTTPQK
jgi:hypothetical protein